MTQPAEITEHAALERVSKLRLIARTVVESFVSGQHRSVYKGFSVEFAQHREYSRGDELRHIDWKVFGKSDKLFVKQYEEETNLRAHLCLDASGSMRYAGHGESKFEYARKVAAALAYLMIGQSDSVGFVAFDDALRQQIPPRGTSGHLSTLLKTLAEIEPDRETNLAPLLHELAGRIRRRGLVIVLSDFFAPVEDLIKALAHLHHKRHEVILFQILDPREIDFPFEEMHEFRCMERPGVRLRLDAPRVAKLYRERFQRFQERLREACHRHRFDHTVLTTNQPYDAALAQYLSRRQESEMVFLNWILIGGLAAVAAPVIIHLLQRNRVTPLDWGAMMFLEELLAERARQIKLRELLLLLVRASILACLALALMRPTILASSGARAPDVHTSAVLLLDDSFSMNAGRARTAWQEARERAIRYVDTLRKGDDVTLLFTSAAGKGAPPAALFDLERVRELIREARPRHESADVARALDAAVKQLETRHNPRRELLFVTDLQAAGWELDDGARWSYLAGLVRSSRIAPQILLTSVGQERPSNVALTGLTPSRSVVDPYAAVTFHVTAANEGPEKAGDAAVTFFVNGAPKATRNVELAPGAREVLAFTYQFERPGSHLVSCRLRSGADELPDDNELLHSVVVLDRLPVLLVDGDRRTQPLASEADFLREALSPRDADDPTWRTVIETTAIDSTELKYADLSKYRVVVLANVAALPGATVGDLERFVVAGGGLLLAPGDRVQLGAYNRDLYRNGAGLLPVSLDKLGLSEPTPLVKVARGPEPAPAYLHLGGIVSNAPALELFRPERGQDWTQARIRQYVATGAPSGQDDVRVLASYSNGAAALVQKNLGEGKVYLLTTAVDTGWSDLPVHPFYVPLMQCLVFDLASAVIPPRNLRVGQALSYVTGAEAARHPHLLYRPQGDPLELAPRRQGALTVYTHDDTAAPGSYLVAPEGAGADERVHYTVTADRAESVMVRLEPGDLRRLERDLGAHYAPDWDSLGRLIGLDGGGYELSAWLILAAAGFCFLETWLLRRWS